MPTNIETPDQSNEQAQGAAGGGEGGGGSAAAAAAAQLVVAAFKADGCGSGGFSDAVRAFQAAEGLSVDGAYGPITSSAVKGYVPSAPAPCPPGTPTPTGGNPTAVQQPGGSSGYQGFSGGSGAGNAAAASALRIAAKRRGLTLSDNMLRILLGHALFESGYGRGDPAHNTLAGTNNWGSMQVTPAFMQAHASDEGFGGVIHQDSDPHRGPFLGWYEVLPNMVEGAYSFLGTVGGALSEDVQTYATNLYHRGYYGGTSTDAQTDIDAYAKAIARSMPATVPADTAQSQADATKEVIGPFAPLFDRMTAVYKKNGKPHGDQASAAQAWMTSWSHPGAYGVKDVLNTIADVVKTGGVTWASGKTPPGYKPGGGGAPATSAQGAGAGLLVVAAAALVVAGGLIAFLRK